MTDEDSSPWLHSIGRVKVKQTEKARNLPPCPNHLLPKTTEETRCQRAAVQHRRSNSESSRKPSKGTNCKTTRCTTGFFFRTAPSGYCLEQLPRQPGCNVDSRSGPAPDLFLDTYRRVVGRITDGDIISTSTSSSAEAS